MTNLLDGIKNLLTDDVMQKASKIVGINKTATSSAVDTFLPAIIGRISNMGSNASGSVALLDLFKKKSLGESHINNLQEILDNKTKTDQFLQSGSSLIDTLFGNTQIALLDKLTEITRIDKAESSILMKLLTPMVVNKLAGLALENDWSASKLSSYLSGQKKLVNPYLSGLSGIQGFEHRERKTVIVENAGTRKTATIPKESDGQGWLKWLLLILVAILALWFLTKDGCNAKDSDSGITATDIPTKTVVTSTHANAGESEVNNAQHDTADTFESKLDIKDNGDIYDGMGNLKYSIGEYYLDNTGNLISSESGSTIMSSHSISPVLLNELKSQLGKYAGVKLTVDEDGNLIDGGGNIIYHRDEFVIRDGFYYDKEGHRLGLIWERIKQAIKDGAERTVEEMSAFFSDLISKKDKSSTSYTLSNIKFDPKDHRIVNFSKAEVVGLAEALKQDKSNKIVVHVYTNDSDSEKRNETLSTTRAQVVKQMLETLGVQKNQITAKGMGSKDPTKANNNKVEIIAQ